MTASKKTKSSQKKTTPKRSSGAEGVESITWLQSLKERSRAFLERRPHRTFKRTRRRDYVRSLALPGYWSFTGYVGQVLWQHKRLFVWLGAIYAGLSAMFIGLGSQDIYTSLSETLRDTSGDLFSGGWGEIGKAGLLLATGVMGSLNQTPTDAQKIYSVILGLLAWLTTVWLLRSILAGGSPRLRDGLYSGGAPVLPTFLVSMVVVVQLLPMAIAVLGFSAATSSGLLDGGVEAMVFWIFAGLLTLLSLYWITGTLMALVVVTLPGMYPLQAIKAAGDMVVGRRIRILLRFLWMALIVIVAWLTVMIPIIMLDAWVKSMVPALQWLPVVPIALIVMSSATVIWTAGYIFLLYRKVVDDDAAAA